MNPFPYPTSTSELANWGKARNLQPYEVRVRFIEFVILNCIAADPVLHSSLVLKGGNALLFFYDSPRSTLDLDFTVAPLPRPLPDDEAELRRLLDHALLCSARQFNIKIKCQSVKRNPRDPKRTWPTYAIQVGYQFSTDRYFHNFDGRNVATTIPLELTFADMICETNELQLAPHSAVTLQVCSLDDIVAEKLRSILQQPIRNRNRSQDVYDIARILQNENSRLDRTKVAEFLLAKSLARGIEPSRSSFDETTQKMARHEYDTRIRNQAGAYFIEFDEAWGLLIVFVESLSLP